MSHEVETAMYVGRPAWHRLGTVVEDAPTVEEAMRLAGLDWQVEKLPLFLPTGDPSRISCATVRSTDHRELGTVGVNFEPLQNVDAFMFFNPFLHEGDATLEAAGSLKHGARVWVLARLSGASGEVVKGDEIQSYLLLYHAHDGSLAVCVTFTPIRVVCWNTATLALSRAERSHAVVKIKHTKNIERSMRLVQRSIDIGRKTFEVTLDTYREMVRHNLPISGFKQYVREVLEVPETETRMPRAWETLEALYEAGAGADLPGVRGSLWGAYNAFTEWTEHRRGRTDATRMDSNWFGPARAVRTRALDVALGMIR